jgi:GNAT superfamily N-acetyltransferase
MRITRTVSIYESGRVLQMRGMFDVPPSAESRLEWDVSLPLSEREWNIGLIVGPSGAGKTTIARELFGPQALAGFDWPADRSILDAFPDSMSIKEITGLLSSVGFSSPPAWLRPFRVLSTGEQFRVSIARALAESPAPHAARRAPGDRPPAVIDEFTSVVDRTVARIGSAAVAKAVRRSGRKLVAVTCHYDVLDWLQPDWVYDMGGQWALDRAPGAGSKPKTADHPESARPPRERFYWRSLQPRPAIELALRRCGREAWSIFKAHHYLSGSLEPAARCFLGTVAVGGAGDAARPAVQVPAAFAAVGHFPHPLRPGWKEHRFVVLPDYQGIGIGNRLSEYLGGVFRATGKPYRAVTSHPAMVEHRLRSPLWRCTRKAHLNVRRNRSTAKGRELARTQAYNRWVWSFEYVGPPNQDDARGFAIVNE